MASARQAAVLTLAACRRQGAWSDGYLKRELRAEGLDRREAALASRLCFGVLQNQMRIDWHLSRVCRLPLDKLEPKVLAILQTAVYQLLFLDKIPDSAAVNEAVKLARAHSRNPRTAGMVNGVLRALLRQMPLPEPEGRDGLDTLAIRTNALSQSVEAFSARLGQEGAEALLEADNRGAPMAVQVNTCRVSAQALRARLEGEGIAARPHSWMPDCLILEGTGNLEELDAFRQGAVLRAGLRGPAGGDGGRPDARGAGAGLLCRPRREILCRRPGPDRPGRGGVLRHPPPQDRPDGGGKSPAGAELPAPHPAQRGGAPG